LLYEKRFVILCCEEDKFKKRVYNMFRKKLVQMVAVFVLTIAPLLLINGSATAATDTCTWTGSGADAFWTTAANWNCSVDGVAAPEDGDSLVFPSGAARLNNSNDFAALIVDSITIDGDGYTLSGNNVTVTPASSTGIYLNGNNINFSVHVTISAASSKAIYNQGTNNAFGANFTISLAGSSDMNINTATGSDLTFNGTVSGTMNSFVLNDNDGLVEFAGLNTFTTSGYMAIFNDGHVVCSDDACLGNSSNLLYLFADAELELQDGITFSNDVTVDASGNSPTFSITEAGVTYDGTLLVNQNLTLEIADTVTDATMAGDITIGSGETLTVVGAGDYTNSTVTFNGGLMSGAGDLAMSAVGVQSYGANATFDGDVFVNNNALLNVIEQALGTTTGTTTVASGGVLRTATGGSQTFDEAITFNGTGNTAGSYSGMAYINEGQAVEFAGTLTIATDTTFSINNHLGTGDDVTISGALAGSGQLTLTKTDAAGGDYVINGTGVSTHSGKIRIEGTTLTLSRTAGVGVAGDVDVVATAIDDAMLLLTNNAGNQIADSAIIHMVEHATNDAIFGSPKPDEVVGSITGEGNIYVTGAGQGITVGGGDASGTYSGLFTNTTPSIITKTGSGTWDISGASYGGVAGQGPTIEVMSGSVKWGGSLGEVHTAIGNGGILKGTGTAGAVTVNAGGTINVGNSPGCMTLASLTLNNGGIFTEEIAGSTACVGYDQTTVAGTANITNSTLNLVLSGTPTAGTTYTILVAGTLTGTFAGLADGATLTSGGTSFRINYSATSVTLTVLSATTTTPSSTPASLASTGSFVVASFIFGLTTIALTTRLYRFSN
jgi:hypothetical protein